VPGWAAIVLLALVAVALPACSGGEDKPSKANELLGAKVEPPYDKPYETLNDTSGKPYNIRTETEGKLTLFYIGYTHCPDICPLHMVELKRALASLPADTASRVTVVFVTADPERDTGEVLRNWLDHFNPAFVGLVPTRQELSEMLKHLGMNYPERTDIGNGNYTVSHAAYVIAFAKDNVARYVYPSGITADDWVHDIPLLLKEGSK
jgi:protein SCO1/2